jgi:hypothetical protein
VEPLLTYLTTDASQAAMYLSQVVKALERYATTGPVSAALPIADTSTEAQHPTPDVSSNPKPSPHGLQAKQP